VYKKILVPVDGSRTAEAGLREAIRLASGNKGASIRLLHVMNPLPALQGMEAAITQQVLDNLEAFGRKVLRNSAALAARKGIRAQTVFQQRYQGGAADAIVAEARKCRADVIVMGTHGRRGLTRVVMGSDAESVVRASPAPVLLVKASAR